MAVPNGENPVFNGRVAAAAFGDKDEKGVTITPATTTGTTPVLVFTDPNPFSGTITGVYSMALGGTAGNITITSDSLTVCVIAKGTTTGAFVGAPSLSNTTITRGGSIAVVSSSAVNAEAQSQVFITYSVDSEQ